MWSASLRFSKLEHDCPRLVIHEAGYATISEARHNINRSCYGAKLLENLTNVIRLDIDLFQLIDAGNMSFSHLQNW
jgi:hypothetical protein